ncbi:MAG: cell division protein ZipA [Pseudomonadota bacterium]
MLGDNSIRYILLIIGALAILFILWDGLRRQKRYHKHAAEPLDLKKIMSREKNSDQVSLLDDEIIGEPRIRKADKHTAPIANPSEKTAATTKQPVEISTDQSPSAAKPKKTIDKKKITTAAVSGEQIELTLDQAKIEEDQPLPTIGLDQLKEIEMTMPKPSIVLSDSEKIATETERKRSPDSEADKMDKEDQTDTEPAPASDAHQIDFIVINVKASTTTPFPGYRLLQVLLNQGLQLGANKFFNAYSKASRQKEILFSVASATAPGTFDLSTINRARCDTLVFFADIKDANDPLHVFDTMLSTAQRVAAALDGQLQLSENQACTKQQIESLRRTISQ